jgi:hypothetical protein
MQTNQVVYIVEEAQLEFEPNKSFKNLKNLSNKNRDKEISNQAQQLNSQTLGKKVSLYCWSHWQRRSKSREKATREKMKTAGMAHWVLQQLLAKEPVTTSAERKRKERKKSNGNKVSLGQKLNLTKKKANLLLVGSR